MIAAQKELEEKILKEVLGFVPPKAEMFFDKYLSDIILPKEVKSFLTDKTTWTSTPSADAYADQSEVIEQGGKHEWMYPKEDIHSLEQLIKLATRSDFMQAGRLYDSHDVFESDPVEKSHHIYRSQNILESSYISRSHWIWKSEYLFGCMRSGDSNFCIGLIESYNCTKSYRLYDASNIVNCLLIKSASDLYECILCSHVQHKKYCIANMQYSKEEYFELKKKILGWLFNK